MSKIVLAVEDDLSEQLAIRRALNDLAGEFRLITVDTGGDALDFLSRRGPYEWRRLDEKPQLVLLDHDLPDMVGFDLVRELRQLSEDADLPVVVYATEVNGAKRKYEDLTVEGPLEKPGDLIEFGSLVVDAIRRALAGREPVTG